MGEDMSEDDTKTTKNGKILKKLREASKKLGDEATWGFVCRSR
jgi:hypothetical protein